MNRTITWELTDEIALRSLRRSFGLRFFLAVAVGFSMVAFLFISFSRLFGEEQARGAFLCCVGLGLMVSVYTWYMLWEARRAFWRYLAKLPHRTNTYTITDEALVVAEPLGSSRLTWHTLKGVEQYKEIWHLHFVASYYLLPAELVDTELADFLEAEARARGVNIYRGRLFIWEPAARSGDAPTGKRTYRWLWNLRWIALMLGACAWLMPRDPPRPAPQPAMTERFVIEAHEFKFVHVPVNRGETIELSLVVKSGSPISVTVWRTDGNRVLPGGVGLLDETGVFESRGKGKWEHSGPAVVIIMARDKSEVEFQARVFPSQ